MFLTIKLCTHVKLIFLKIERTICIKMDLALNDLQRLICHKTQPTNHTLSRHLSQSGIASVRIELMNAIFAGRPTLVCPWMVCKVDSKWSCNCCFLGVLLTGFVQSGTQHLCEIPINIFHYYFR